MAADPDRFYRAHKAAEVMGGQVRVFFGNGWKEKPERGDILQLNTFAVLRYRISATSLTQVVQAENAFRASLPIVPCNTPLIPSLSSVTKA